MRLLNRDGVVNKVSQALSAILRRYFASRRYKVHHLWTLWMRSRVCGTSRCDLPRYYADGGQEDCGPAVGPTQEEAGESGYYHCETLLHQHLDVDAPEIVRAIKQVR